MRKRLTVPRVCQWCRADFAASVYDAGKFCSRACYWAAKPGTGRPLADRFWEKVDKSGDCWMWLGAPRPDGYGNLGLEGTIIILAHRASWIINRGPIPDDLHVCHTCDVRLCVNPNHLFLGTNADNHADKIAKGRQARGDRSGPRLHPERMPRGEGHVASKLTETGVREIRRRYAEGGVRLIDLADEYGVSLTVAHNVIKRKSWAHVD